MPLQVVWALNDECERHSTNVLLIVLLLSCIRYVYSMLVHTFLSRLSLASSGFPCNVGTNALLETFLREFFRLRKQGWKVIVIW